MTGEELARSLLDQIAARRQRSGEFVITSMMLEQLLHSCLPRPESEEGGPARWQQETEPGYPKRMTKSRPSLTPWAPSMEVPESRYVHNQEEEDEAKKQGFGLATF